MKDSGSREPLHFLLFSTSLLSNGNPAALISSGVFYVIHYFLRIFSGLPILDLHNHFQAIDQFTGFQLIPVNNGNSKLRGTVSGCGIATSGRDDGRFRSLSTEPVSENGKLIESFRLNITDLAADEKRDDSSGCHDIDLVDHTSMTQNFIPANYSAADNIIKDIGIQTGFVYIKLQNAAHIPEPGPGIYISEPEGD